MGHDRTMDLAHRDAMIMELKGPPHFMTDRQIAEVFDISRVRVLQIRHKWIEKHVSPKVEFYRDYITAECLRGIAALGPKVDAGDHYAMASHRGYLDRLARLHGTDAPQVQEINYSAKWNALGWNFGKKEDVIEGETVDEP